MLLGLVVVSVLGKASASKKKGLCVGPSTHMCNDFKLWHKVNWWYVLIYFLLTVKAATLIFIFGRGSAMSSAKEVKSGFIYNLVKSL